MLNKLIIVLFFISHKAKEQEKNVKFLKTTENGIKNSITKKYKICEIFGCVEIYNRK